MTTIRTVPVRPAAAAALGPPDASERRGQARGTVSPGSDRTPVDAMNMLALHKHPSAILQDYVSSCTLHVLHINFAKPADPAHRHVLGVIFGECAWAGRRCPKQAGWPRHARWADRAAAARDRRGGGRAGAGASGGGGAAQGGGAGAHGRGAAGKNGPGGLPHQHAGPAAAQRGDAGGL